MPWATLAWKTFITSFLLIPTALWAIGWVGPAKSRDCSTMTQKKIENTHYKCTHYFLNLIKKPLALIMQLGRKVCMFLGFTNCSSVPAKSSLPVLSMLLLCQEEQHQSHRELGRKMKRGFSRVKVDLRTPSQEKGHTRFIANHFQKVELKVVGFFHGFYQLRVPLLIWGCYIFKKPCALLLLKATSASLLCETPPQTGNGTNGTRCQSEKKLSSINLLSYLFPVPQRAPELPFFFHLWVRNSKNTSFSLCPQPCPWPHCLISPSTTHEGKPAALPTPSPGLPAGAHLCPPTPNQSPQLTLRLLLDLQSDRLSCHLQQVNGFAQRFALEAHVINR